MNGTCKSKEEIEEYLIDKYVIVYQNMQRFQSRIYNESRVISESKTIYFPINLQVRTETVNYIQTTDLEL